MEGDGGDVGWFGEMLWGGVVFVVARTVWVFLVCSGKDNVGGVGVIMQRQCGSLGFDQANTMWVSWV